jgi:hypothetical protein
MSANTNRMLIAAVAVLAQAHAHGVLTKPASRSVKLVYGDDADGMATAGFCNETGFEVPSTCGWFGNLGDPQTNPRTLPDSLMTWHDYSPYNSSTLPMAIAKQTTPWFAPGATTVNAPCGEHGTFGRMEDLPRTTASKWHRGGQEEVAWSPSTNHGGGYAYRLCPLPSNSSAVSEDCFQSHHLEFAGTTAWVQWGAETESRVAFTAQRLATGTVPEGSQWTKNPVPGCVNSPDCRYRDPWPECPTGNSSGCVGDTFTGTQFAPPAPGVSGGGYPAPVITSGVQPGPSQDHDWWGADFNIVDLVHVPASLKPGDYLLSFRWDCEESNEVFMGCADVMLV